MRRQPISWEGVINDIHAMTGPTVYSNIVYKILNLNYPYSIKRGTEEIFYHDNKPIKLIGIDYNNFFIKSFLLEMYNDNCDHWRQEQIRNPLLKNGAFFDNERFKLIKDSDYLYYISR